MNVEIGTVLACTATGCQVQLFNQQPLLETRFSKPIVKYDIPIRPQQFVLVDLDTTPPETIFRWSRAKVAQIAGEQLMLNDEGRLLSARRDAGLMVDLQAGDEVVFVGFDDENRVVIDLVQEGKPARSQVLQQAWVPRMSDAAARALE